MNLADQFHHTARFFLAQRFNCAVKSFFCCHCLTPPLDTAIITGGVQKCYRASLRSSSARYSLARHETAAIDSVQFFSGQETNEAPSTTKRFLTSCAWLNLLSTEVFGSSPIRAVPTSCVASPGGGGNERVYGMTSAPAARSNSSAVSNISSAIFNSLSCHLALKRSCGMP